MVAAERVITMMVPMASHASVNHNTLGCTVKTVSINKLSLTLMCEFCEVSSAKPYALISFCSSKTLF